MKKIALIAAMGLIGMGSAMAQSTATGNFNVLISLTSKCEINSTNAATGAVIGDLDLGTYTSFQTGPATGSTNFNVRCTNNLPYSIGLNNTTAVIDGVVGIEYTLNLSAAAGYAAGTNGSLPGLIADGSNQTYYVHGTAVSGQAGTCNAASCTNAAALNRGRTVTITY
jgi:spore coat protein U-like protein